MAQPYSMDFREPVILAVKRDGLSRNEVARRFGVAISTAMNWLRRYHETGSVEPGQMGGHRPRKLIGAHLDWLLERTMTDFTLRGLQVGDRLLIDAVASHQRPQALFTMLSFDGRPLSSWRSRAKPGP